jgi:carboxyl-terminal processing protease
MRTFFSVASMLLVLLGIGWLLFPETMLDRWAVGTDAVGIFVARRYGALLLGFAAMLWYGRSSGPSPARTAILGGAAFAAAAVAAVSFSGVITRTVGPGAWLTAVIEAVLAAGFLFFLLTSRVRASSIRRANIRFGFLLVVFCFTAACGGVGPTGPTSPPTGPSSAQAYLERMLDIMQARSINRRTIEWAAFRASVLAQAPGAQTVSDTYPAIRHALDRLDDGHSSYRAATGTFIFVPKRSCAPTPAVSPPLPATIGYVRVSSFNGSGTAAIEFAGAIQNAIRAADRDDLAGWIVDLRGNGGGNMWPMIAGIGPVLGDGVAGHFIDPDGVTQDWGYAVGAALAVGSVVLQVPDPYRLRRERPRVAVLTDVGVASSGEAVAVAFRERPGTRSFGTPTCGLSTSNESFPLSDGAVLNLTVSTMADRTRRLYGDAIVPDEVVNDPAVVVARAVAWLEGR